MTAETKMSQAQILTSFLDIEYLFRSTDGETCYAIEVLNPSGNAGAVASVSIDGRPWTVEDGAARIPLSADGAMHRVVVTLGAPQ